MKKEDLSNFSEMVNKEIAKHVNNGFKSTTLFNAVQYAFSTGGKRLRSSLCLLMCETLGGNTTKALPFAVAIEIIHNATLVHDDLEDGDSVRRNSPTVWVKYGIPHGINTGDGLIFKAYECLLSSSFTEKQILELTEMLTKSLMKIVDGQSMEFDFRQRDDIRTEEYFDMVEKKTAELMGLSLSSAAFITNKRDLQPLLMEYGKKLGLAFQIRDDILNLFGDGVEYGKEIGGDIKEGKRTLMIIDCLKKCKESEKERLINILKRGRNRVTKNDVKFAIELVKKYKSKEEALDYIRKIKNEIHMLLNKINDAKLKLLLGELFDLIIGDIGV